MPPSIENATDKTYVKIVEVGPRDGLQDVKHFIETADKHQLISLLSECGFAEIEVAAFVSPKWVPQMADHDTVMRGVKKKGGLILSVLVPNEKGAKAALEAGAEKLSVFTSASESFAIKNINCSIAESLERFKPVVHLAKAQGVSVRGYVSCAIHCPYEGQVLPESVVNVAKALQTIGCDEIAVADTVGQAKPDEVRMMFRALLNELPSHSIAAHFHDALGLAIQNVDASLESGVTTFDAAIGGLGGCPYAPGAAGNISTLTLVRHLESKGLLTRIDQCLLSRAEEFANKTTQPMQQT
jgi:hydroxymethylglutaryl-CoA lyase